MRSVTEIVQTIDSLNFKSFSDYKFLVEEIRGEIEKLSKVNTAIVLDSYIKTEIRQHDLDGYNERRSSLEYIKKIYDNKLLGFVRVFFIDEQIIRNNLKQTPSLLDYINSWSMLYFFPLGSTYPTANVLLISQKNFERNYKSGYYLSPKKSSKGSDEGCFIATYAYGSYEHQNVLTLRTFRDNVLIKSIIGRRFISFYYSCSPFLIKMFSAMKFPKQLIRIMLDCFIEFLIYFRKKFNHR